MMKLLAILLFLFWSVTGAEHSQADELANQIRVIQAKIETLNGGEETPQKKQLKEIYLDTQQVLHDHQEYLKRTQLCSQQLKEYPQQLEILRKQKDKAISLTFNATALAGLSLSEMEQQHVITQAKLSELQNQQQKLTSEIGTLRQRTIKIREEIDATSKTRASLAEKAPLATDMPDEKIADAFKMLQEYQSRALTDKIRMLELEALTLPKAIEIATLQEKLTLNPEIQMLVQKVEWLTRQINLQRKTETKKVVEKSEQLLGESKWNPALLKIIKHNEELAAKLSNYAAHATKLMMQKNHNENRLNFITKNYAALQQRLEFQEEDEELGTEIRKQLKELLSKPNIRPTQKSLSSAKLELFQLEQEKLEMMNDKAYFKKMTGDYAIDEQTPFYQEITTGFQELKDSRLHIIDQFQEILHSYVKDLEVYVSIKNQLIEKINQYELLLKENLLITRSAKPIDLNINNDLSAAAAWLVSDKTQTALVKTSEKVWLPAIAILAFSLLIGLILKRFYWSRYREWEEIGKEAWGKVNQDKARYPIGMLLFVVVQSLVISLPLLLIHLVLQYSMNTEMSHAFSLAFYVAAVTIFFWYFLFELCQPTGLLITQFRWHADMVNKMYRDIKYYAPTILVLSVIVAFTDALADDVVRNSIGRIAFMLLCIVLAVFALGWMAITPSGKVLYQGKSFTFIQNPRLWMLLLFVQQVYMIVMAARGYYFAALYQSILIFQSVILIILCSLVFFLSYRSLLIAQRRIAFKRAIAKREEMLALRATAGKSETEFVDDNYIDIKSISTQSATLLKISVWGLLIGGLSVIWYEMLPALGFLENIVVWRTSIMREGEAVVRLITLETLLVALIILSLVMVAAHNLPGTLELLVLRHLSLNTGTGYAITTLLRYAIIIIGVMVTFQMLGMEWSNIQWLVAALGVGLGFGLQEIVANFVSGLILLFERPIRIGDLVTLNDVTGTVSKINIRATTLIDADRKEVVVPNKTFITQQLLNWTLSDQVTRIKIPVGIAYGSDCDRARTLLLEIAKNHPLVLREPEPVALFQGFGASSLDFELRVYAGQLSDRQDLAHDLNMEINRRFAEEKINIAFPQLDIHLYRENNNTNIPK
ncbi:mechanosensitive ion channel domain-containing protein [Nitrosomonas sp. Nm34]|uniref:mechanosensitive ion channel domain-containing protein n=1 Tax=Nitrosomonas sp. Nm34 TaxID=1881055 RepID=UPI0008E9D306|nr:mechanosensitive ion channel domain-containing protein [Nitrosomonas sp. Nm34]SFI49484.1 potassium efflux system protein [Nitrosomonas sp. Nm34]